MKLPTGPDKFKVIGVVAVLALTAIWMSYILLTSGSGYRTGKPLNTPGWNAANDLNAKLLAEKSFADVAASVVSERPLKFKIEGMIHPPATIEELKSFVEQHKGGAELEIDVVELEH